MEPVSDGHIVVQTLEPQLQHMVTLKRAEPVLDGNIAVRKAEQEILSMETPKQAEHVIETIPKDVLQHLQQ